MIISNKNNRIEKLALNFMLIFGLFSSYIEFSQIWNVLLLFIFILILAISKDFRTSILNNSSIPFFTIIFFVLLIINIFNSQSYGYIIGNLTQLIKVVIILIIICGIANEDNYIFKDFMMSKFKLINFMWMLNIIVLFIQEKGTGFLIKSKWLAINSYYPDQCSGLFGNSGTHILALFSIFVFVYNSFYITYKENKKNIGLLTAYNYITMIIMLLLSTKNDNNSIFILYLIFICFYFFAKSISQKTQLIKKIINILTYTIISFCILLIIYKIPVINEFINNTLLTRISLVFDDNQNALGSNERLAIYYYSLNNSNGWKMGNGISSWPFDQPNYMGFVHFGLSSIGTITMLGGIWLYIYMLFYYSRIFLGKVKWNEKSIIIYLINILILVILSIFTVILTSGILIFWLALIMNMINKIALNFEKGNIYGRK